MNIVQSPSSQVTLVSGWKIFEVKKFISPLKVVTQTERSIIILCRDSIHKTHVIVKIGERNFMEREEKCLRSLSHPNIVSLVDHFSDEKNGYVILEHLKGESLISLISPHDPVSEYVSSNIAKQVVDGCQYLHSKGWVHRDLKPDNIIYDPHTRTCKIIDFEFSCTYGLWKNHHSSKGTLLYSAPELRKGNYKGPEIDVWSFGVTMYVLLTGFFPFTENQLKDNEEVFEKPEGITDHPINFLEQLLIKDKKFRPSMRKISQHPWLSLNPS